MAETEFDIVVIGAGIIGLATALEATTSLPSLKVAVLEKENRIGLHQSGHNSGVIHSGIYYLPGSLKARNCVAGAAAMVRFCREHDIKYDICGKVVIATNDAELLRLNELLRRGELNGVEGLAIVGQERLAELEPECAGVAALHVPTAGITDYKAVTAKLAELIKKKGGTIFTDCGVRKIAVNERNVFVESACATIRAKFVINCAGLHSDRIMRLTGNSHDLQIIPFRGEYYKLTPERSGLIRNLVYPVSDPQFPFLGVHFTRHIEGYVEAGPNAVISLKREGYRKTDFNLRDTYDTATFPGFWRLARRHWSYAIDEMYRSYSKAAFTKSLQKLLPAIREEDLQPGHAGVRAQALDNKGNLLDDFAIIPEDRIIHVCNVPSPAATASLIIGRQIVEMTARKFNLPIPNQR